MAWYPCNVNSDLGGKEPTKLGSYSGNQTIDISSVEDYLKKTFYYTNISFSDRYVSVPNAGGNAHSGGTTLSLSVNGSTLTITGGAYSFWCNDAGGNTNYGSNTISYEIYYV